MLPGLAPGASRPRGHRPVAAPVERQLCCSTPVLSRSWFRSTWAFPTSGRPCRYRATSEAIGRTCCIPGHHRRRRPGLAQSTGRGRRRVCVPARPPLGACRPTAHPRHSPLAWVLHDNSPCAFYWDSASRCTGSSISLASWCRGDSPSFAASRTRRRLSGDASTSATLGRRFLGLAWLLGGLDFFVAAMGIWLAAPWALWMVMVAAALSICLCLAGAPASAPGLFVDGLIFAAVLTARGTGLWAPPTP